MQKRKRVVLGGAVSLLLALLYLNSLSVPLYFDDLSILQDTFKVERLTPGQILRASFRGELHNRPVANITFVLNYFFTGARPIPFHLTNVLIHILSFWFVFLFVLELLGLSGVAERYRRKRRPLALAAAAVWAVHPLQTQAVTYVIQRYTSLCGLFSFMALYFYLRGRRERRTPLFVGSAAAFVLALGSKEIAAVLPVVVLLIEILFGRLSVKKAAVWAGVFLVLSGGLAALFVGERLSEFVDFLKRDQFPNRDYRVSEGLLTQPRVFVHYISLALLPSYDRHILDYNFPVSHGLLAPPATAFSLLFGLATLVAAAWALRRNRIVTFAILAFWIGHVMEGSIFNLELAFEHRMYLPSVFLFLLVVAAGSDLALRWALPPRAVTAGFILVLLYLGTNTILRNDVWRDPARFYTHNIRKAPGNFRPYSNMGVWLLGRSRLPEAAGFLEKAKSLNPREIRILGALADVKFGLKDYAAAAPLYAQTLDAGLAYPFVFERLAISLMRVGRFEDAAVAILSGIKQHPDALPLMVTAGSLFYIGKQEGGGEGVEAMRRSGLDEAGALGFLETAYRRGLRSADLFANLAPALVARADQESDPAARARILENALRIAREGAVVFPADELIRHNIALIAGRLGRENALKSS